VQKVSVESILIDFNEIQQQFGTDYNQVLEQWTEKYNEAIA
jgi:hypothetical protein